MKIHQHEIIKLQGTARLQGILKNIPAGRELRAEILERLDGKTADISINGKKIRADFLHGVPGGNSIRLKYEKSINNTYLFKIVSDNDADVLNNKLSEFLITNSSMFKERHREIFKFLHDNPAGIYELNWLVINPDGKNKKDNRHALLLNRLLKSGFNRNLLVYLSFIMSGTGFGRDVLFFIYSLTGNTAFSGGKNSRLENNEINEIISDIINELDSINDRDLADDAVSGILESLFIDGAEGNGIREGELSILDDSEFKAMKYFFSDNSLIFTLNLSALGIIEILAKKTDKNVVINIFSERENVIEYLKKSEELLLSRVRMKIADFSVNFINSKIMLDNLKDFYRNYMINNIDLKA